MAWPLRSSGRAYYGGFGDLGVGYQGGFDLHRAEAVAADVDDVVHAAHEPEVAVFVAASAVSR